MVSSTSPMPAEERIASAAGDAAGPPSPCRPRTVVAAALGAYVVAVAVLVGALGFTSAWYGFHDLSDTELYLRYVHAIEAGYRPYLDFPVEYPPLAVSVLTIAGGGTLAGYTLRFNVLMLATGAATAVLVAAAASRVWPGARRACAAAVTFGGCVLATGAIVANRLDLAVALVVAAAVLLTVMDWTVLAAAVLGVGFALKLTPVLLLPLVLLRATRPRAAAAALAAFGLAAALPFLPYLGSAGLRGVFAYHLERPLQLESVVATPVLAAHALGLLPARVGTGFGSQFVASPWSPALTAASGPAAAAALAITYALVWRARRRVRAEARLVAVAALAVILGPVAFGKVLSPQFLVWVLPVIALVLPEVPPLGALLIAVLALTQVEFPALYERLVRLEPLPIAVVAARNAGVLAAFVLSVREVIRWGRPPAPPHGPGVSARDARSAASPGRAEGG